jgi:hypothetical protein
VRSLRACIRLCRSFLGPTKVRNFRNAPILGLRHYDFLDDELESAVFDSVRNLKTSEIELLQPLPKLECEWLVGQLRDRRGIASARCASDERHLTVEYDADRLVSGDVVDFLRECGVSVAAVHANRLEAQHVRP